MFEIGDRVFWVMGHGDFKTIVRAIYVEQIDEEYSEVNTYENNNRYWQTKQTVLTSLLQKDVD